MNSIVESYFLNFSHNNIFCPTARVFIAFYIDEQYLSLGFEMSLRFSEELNEYRTLHFLEMKDKHYFEKNTLSTYQTRVAYDNQPFFLHCLNKHLEIFCERYMAEFKHFEQIYKNTPNEFEVTEHMAVFLKHIQNCLRNVLSGKSYSELDDIEPSDVLTLYDRFLHQQGSLNLYEQMQQGMVKKHITQAKRKI